MKTQMTFLTLGAGLGAAITWMITSEPSPTPPPVAAKPETTRPADTRKSPAMSEERTDGPTRPLPPDQPLDLSSLPPPTAAQQIPAEVLKELETRRQDERTLRINERLAAFKDRLKLTPDQLPKLRALLGKINLTHGDASKVLGTPSPQARELNDQLNAFLSPEQQELFAAFQQEQLENQSEIATNREMAQLQQQLMLTPEQKDRAYQLLGEIARKEVGQPFDLADRQAVDAARQERVDALRKVLTDEQMEVYERNPPLGFAIPDMIETPNGGAFRMGGTGTSIR